MSWFGWILLSIFGVVVFAVILILLFIIPEGFDDEKLQ